MPGREVAELINQVPLFPLGEIHFFSKAIDFPSYALSSSIDKNSSSRSSYVMV